MTVTANIDISTATGRKLVRELEKHKRVVQLTYNEPVELPEGSISLEEGVEEFWKHLEEHFGFDLRTNGKV
ncbi:MAG: hypothetical protein WCK78_18615 [Paludibacter sp.]